MAGDVVQIQMTAYAERADHVVDHDVNLRLLLLRFIVRARFFGFQRQLGISARRIRFGGSVRRDRGAVVGCGTAATAAAGGGGATAAGGDNGGGITGQDDAAAVACGGGCQAGTVTDLSACLLFADCSVAYW